MPSLAPGRQATERADQHYQLGDVFIPRKFRVRNQNGNCVWAAAEDCFWGAAGLEPFKGMKERAVKTGWHGSSMSAVIAALKSANVPYTATFGRDYKVLYESVGFGTGCYIEIPGHAIVLVGIDEKTVRTLDNNGNLEYQLWQRRDFDLAWNGCAVFPRLRLRPPVKPAPYVPAPSPSTPHPPLNPEAPRVPDQKPEPIGPPKQPEVLPPPKVQPDVSITVLNQILVDLKELKEMRAKPGPPGKDGERGPQGPPGKDVNPAEMDELKSRVKNLEDALQNFATTFRIRAVPVPVQ